MEHPLLALLFQKNASKHDDRSVFGSYGVFSIYGFAESVVFGDAATVADAESIAAELITGSDNDKLVAALHHLVPQSEVAVIEIGDAVFKGDAACTDDRAIHKGAAQSHQPHFSGGVHLVVIQPPAENINVKIGIGKFLNYGNRVGENGQMLQMLQVLGDL